jgi:hypothetical protein
LKFSNSKNFSSNSKNSTILARTSYYKLLLSFVIFLSTPSPPSVTIGISVRRSAVVVPPPHHHPAYTPTTKGLFHQRTISNSLTMSNDWSISWPSCSTKSISLMNPTCFLNCV